MGRVSPKTMEEIVLIDDERSSFWNDTSDNAVLRFCKVPRYDDVYGECGHLNQLGGLGARDESDYATLMSFVKEPWKYPCATEELGTSPCPARVQGKLDKSASEMAGHRQGEDNAIDIVEVQKLPDLTT